MPCTQPVSTCGAVDIRGSLLKAALPLCPVAPRPCRLAPPQGEAAWDLHASPLGDASIAEFVQNAFAPKPSAGGASGEPALRDTRCCALFCVMGWGRMFGPRAPSQNLMRHALPTLRRAGQRNPLSAMRRAVADGGSLYSAAAERMATQQAAEPAPAAAAAL